MIECPHIDYVQARNIDTSTLAIGERCLKRGLRLDGRRLDSFRRIEIDFIGPPGHVIVSFGNTIVFCAIVSEVVEPNTEHPNEGFYYFNVEAAPFTMEAYDPGKVTDLEHSLCYFIENIFKESGSLNLESLCIASGKFVWAIRVNLHVLQNDGNLYGICSFASLAALLDYRKHEVNVDGHEMNIVEANWHSGIPLCIYNLPILVNVAIIDDEIYLIDQSIFEEKMPSTQISLLYNQFGELFWIYKIGGNPISLDAINNTTEIGKKKAVQLYSILRHELDNNAKIRKNLLKFSTLHYSRKTIDI